LLYFQRSFNVLFINCWFLLYIISWTENCATSGCACAHSTLPREPRKGHVTFDDVVSGEKTPLGRILLTRRGSLGCAHAQPEVAQYPP
jgi:hypothetical protein